MNETLTCACDHGDPSWEALERQWVEWGRRNPEQATWLLAKMDEQTSTGEQGLQGATPPEDLAAAGLGPDGAPLVGASPDVMPLARVELSNGNTIEFVGVRGDSKEPEVGMRELGQLDRATGATFAAERDVTALELYLRLAPKDAPVPDMLLELNPAVERKAFKHRTVERVEDAIEVDLDELGIAPDIARAGPSSGGGPGQSYCVPGDGYDLFRNHNCETVSFPSNTWWWCDPAAHYYHRDRWTSNHKRRNSVGVTSACHGPAATLHYYKNAFGNWRHLHTWHLASGYWQWTRYEGLSKRDRWIRHRCVTGGGSSFVRCVSFFFN
ncbi:hypothetical protein KUW18_00710 [Halomonas sp. DP5Y7-2]|uniref:hypothetical protein n=1 Tax=Halomonas sp. DP5Y7-2 TaxID=2859076 RepID=UPI001C997731|nr:hypothetical protein [Halomonas sp. DP5Y7-2]MBY5982599.1 hypothetical protein [Halomonas sp. DP5Y7-2]